VRAVLLLGCAALLLTGCGQVGPKEVRVESSAVASTATEGATVASEFGRGRLAPTFAKQQLRTLSSSASSPADSLGKSAPVDGSAILAARTQALALESQRRLNDLAEHLDQGARRAADSRRLLQISREASTISDQAEAIE
jgi:hypothetical protein